ncbi:MAG TPA: putative lipid II flippase FtsW [Acidobacteria bacterium]|nr:putative lipid II flippase FtsW [Acidobacteriota bacterium]
MPLKQRYDRVLMAATAVQTVLGLALVASASWLIAEERYHRPGTWFVLWQAAAALAGLVALVAAMHLRRRLLDDERIAWAVLGGVWVLLAAAFLGPAIAHTHRWVGFGPVSIQPSVLARVAIVLFAAVELPRAAREGWPTRRLLRFGGAVLLTALLIVLEPDLGSAVLLVAAATAMAWVAGLPLRHFAAPAVAGLAGLVAAIAAQPYRLARIEAFLHPDVASAAAWQTRQSLIALGSGGLLGRGYGAGLQKLFFLPEPHTDFILAIAGEELGLLGVTFILLVAGIIVWRGLRIAARQTNPSHALLAFGLSFAFALQTLLHAAVCLGLAPPKGIPLPLISYGRTDLIVTLGTLGLLLNLGREVDA